MRSSLWSTTADWNCRSRSMCSVLSCFFLCSKNICANDNFSTLVNGSRQKPHTSCRGCWNKYIEKKIWQTFHLPAAGCVPPKIYRAGKIKQQEALRNITINGSNGSFLRGRSQTTFAWPRGEGVRQKLTDSDGGKGVVHPNLTSAALPKFSMAARKQRSVFPFR